jgi:2-C-methyl-D-erythritol 4-phosphate cytidylyltransferase
VTIGGETRFQSVRNGIKLVGHQVQYVGVHDGVRPFVHEELIRRCFLSAEKSKAVIPVVLPKDSLRILRQNDSEVLPRDQVRIVQTPQVFDRNILADAYKTEYRETFTDDASVVEFAGHKIELIEGTYTNIKITDQQDLTFANHLFRHGITS